MSELKICNKCEGTPLEKLADFCGFPNCYGTHEEMTVLALDQHKEITRLKERLEELQRENEWVSVEDRLPDTLGEHLVLVAPLAGCGFYSAAWYHDGLWEVRGENGNARDLITHWKPIAPPKEG